MICIKIAPLIVLHVDFIKKSCPGQKSQRQDVLISDRGAINRSSPKCRLINTANRISSKTFFPCPGFVSEIGFPQDGVSKQTFFGNARLSTSLPSPWQGSCMIGWIHDLWRAEGPTYCMPARIQLTYPRKSANNDVKIGGAGAGRECRGGESGFKV